EISCLLQLCLNCPVHLHTPLLVTNCFAVYPQVFIIYSDYFCHRYSLTIFFFNIYLVRRIFWLKNDKSFDLSNLITYFKHVLYIWLLQRSLVKLSNQCTLKFYRDCNLCHWKRLLQHCLCLIMFS
uniref:Uncharacterized protein n=1 Tax=Crocodylus porosus TaxID=8502 RepID=A0A7M4F6A3_CROPO